MSVPKNKRNAKLAAFYAKGHSMREVSDRFDVSLERVRQILRRGYPHLIRPQYDTRNNSTGLTASARAAR